MGSRFEDGDTVHLKEQKEFILTGPINMMGHHAGNYLSCKYTILYLRYFFPVMQRAPPSSNMVLVKADSGRDVNLVGIKDAASRNVIRVQAGHDRVLI